MKTEVTQEYSSRPIRTGLKSSIKGNLILLGIGLIIGVFSLPCIGAYAQNAMTLPQVIARISKGGKVIVTVSPVWGNVTAVVVQRKSGKGKFKTVATRKVSGPTVRFVDSVSSTKSLRYRAQFKIGKQIASNWSVEAPAGTRVSAETISTSNSNGCPAAVVETLAVLVNRFRSDNGLAVLALQSALQESAQVHSSKMAVRNLLSHDGWVAEVRTAGFTRPVIGQNVAVGFPTPESVLAAWVASPGHRSNLLQPLFTLAGYGCAIDSTGVTWWSHNFGG